MRDMDGPTAKPVIIGPAATSADRAGIAALVRSWHGDVFVAHQGRVAVGMAGARSIDPRTWELTSLFVRPAARRAHVGRRLLDAVVEAARIGGAHQIIVPEAGRWPSPAVAMLISHGFRVAGQRATLDIRSWPTTT